VEATDIGGMLRVDETRGLLTIDNLIEMTMEEGIFNVELMYGPSMRESERKNYVDGGWFNDRAESFIKVNAGLL
jgi:hypothetical protein